MPHQVRAFAVPSRAVAEARVRASHWRFFQIIFLFTYAGILMDVATTALGSSAAGSVASYEQNPIGGLLIARLGWAGLLASLTAMMLLAYASLRVAHERVSPGWIRFFNWALLLTAALRWLAVVTAIAYVVHAGI